MGQTGLVPAVAGMLAIVGGCSVYDGEPLTAAAAPNGVGRDGAAALPEAHSPPATIASTQGARGGSAERAPNQPSPGRTPEPQPSAAMTAAADAARETHRADEADAGWSGMSQAGAAATARAMRRDETAAAGAGSTVTMTAPPVAQPSPACRGQLGYVSEVDGHCYYRFAEPVSWYVARDECGHAHGHLAALTTAAERDFVASIDADEPMWIGLSRFGAVNFTWITGELFSFASWQQGSPHMLPESAVLSAPATGLWFDREPSELHPGLCEIEPASAAGDAR